MYIPTLEIHILYNFYFSISLEASTSFFEFPPWIASNCSFVNPWNTVTDSDVLTQIEDGTFYAIQEDAIGSMTMSELEQEMIERALEKFRGNRRKTARALNISERTLYRKINDFGIQKKIKDA